jgi:uncharacterized protein YbaA (DUF1428 family)
MRLLKEVPAAALWLLEANSLAKDNLRREAAQRGVDPDRLVFAPRVPSPEHLARHRLADLFLDTLPYNAHMTASDALWAGLPVLTCLGETFPGRVAASMLHAAGLPELVTQSLAAYESLALRLAHEPALLQGLRHKLLGNRLSAPLFDIAQYARHYEAALTQMWENWANGHEPQGFAIPSSLPGPTVASAARPIERIAYRACPPCESSDIESFPVTRIACRERRPAMAKYVDGFVVPVPKNNIEAYRRFSEEAGKIWREHGALEYVECIGDDVKPGKITSFPQAVKLEPDETVVFAWIVYESREERDRINAAVMKDPRIADKMDPKSMPFDGMRMFWGGFEVLIEL